MSHGDTGAPKLPPAYRLIALGEVTSTNDEAQRLAAEGAEDGTLVWARAQTRGRGRSGRDWASAPGNLFMSLVLRPDCPLSEAAQLGFVAALAVKDGIGSVAPPGVEVTFKWPNDVLLGGRKGAGILLESKTTAEGALDWLILGIGVNVASYPEEARFPATSLRFEGAPPDIDAETLLVAVSRHFLTWVNRWLDDGFAPLRQAWIAHAKGLGEEIEVRLPKETLTGVFETLDEEGALILCLPDGAKRRITAGDVHFGE